ncbi:dihydrodipicolinate synthase family protein [Oleiharenicola lentus]|jgi:4-hydroxy-tetrahydrodipicolinate synthase|uniref:Dihydrodipicolinate synthase family protein n=1 Tax=Oleiharenicola lentus TaxID=2508720 RepID=A0A4Q1C5D0_9BACT|nr:dihydrodipicolinate synthase family protein [Oleiharenicola lentus]RXK53638.1 dihydrodipicolinate synthase family protein [Oleiharenicola lentus]
MTSFPRHHGVIVPLVTPVQPDGSLDEAAAERLVDHLASNGCGMLVLGTTGEVASLPAALRLRYVEIAVRVAAKRTPVFACPASNCVSFSLESGNAYLKAGVDAVVGILPNYYKLEAAEMLAYFERLADGIRGPLMIYNMPATTGMSLPLDVIETLARRSNVTGLKDSEGTAGRREEVAKRFGGRPDFSLFMGIAAHSIPALRLGFDGLVPSGGNLYPERWSALYQAARAGDWAKAEQLQTQLDAIGAVFQRNRTLGQSLAALKAGLGLRGLCGPAMVPPLLPLSAADQEAVRAELVRLG